MGLLRLKINVRSTITLRAHPDILLWFLGEGRGKAADVVALVAFH